MKKTRSAGVLIASIVLLALASSVQADVEAISLPWWTVDSGGGPASGGSFSLNGSIGQAEAGGMSGGQFELFTGFWPGSKEIFIPEEHLLFLPLTLKS